MKVGAMEFGQLVDATGTTGAGVTSLRGSHLGHGSAGADTSPLSHRPRLRRSSHPTLLDVRGRRGARSRGGPRLADDRVTSVIAPVPLRLRAGWCLDWTDDFDVVWSGSGAGDDTSSSATNCRYHEHVRLSQRQHCKYYNRQWGNGVFTRSSKRPTNVFKIHVLMLDVCWIVWTPYNYWPRKHRIAGGGLGVPKLWCFFSTAKTQYSMSLDAVPGAPKCSKIRFQSRLRPGLHWGNSQCSPKSSCCIGRVHL